MTTSTNIKTATFSLEELLIMHRVSLVPKYNDVGWHAGIHDNDSIGPTRNGEGLTPLAAVNDALSKPQSKRILESATSKE